MEWKWKWKIFNWNWKIFDWKWNILENLGDWSSKVVNINPLFWHQIRVPGNTLFGYGDDDDNDVDYDEDNDDDGHDWHDTT